MADPTYGPKVYNKQDGDELVIASGGTLTVESGGTLANAGTEAHTGTQTFDDIVGNDASLDITGAAAASVTAVGGAVNLVGTVGGATSGTGGATAITAGAGTGVTTVGGAASATAGVGGTGTTTSAGGVGGAATVTAGAGGAKTGTGNAAGGAGGAGGVVAGVGGATASSGSDNAGVGGALGVTAGAGGAASAGTGDGGAGGDVTLTPGAGGTSAGGAAGAPGDVVIANGVLRMATPQTIDMADAAVALTLVPGTPSGTTLSSNLLFVDANSAGTEDLTLPPEADCDGLWVLIFNTGGESIILKDDGGATLSTILTAESCLAACNGTAWNAQNFK